MDPSKATTSAIIDEELNNYLINDDSDDILTVPSTLLDKPTNDIISNLENNTPSTSKTTSYIAQRNVSKPKTLKQDKNSLLQNQISNQIEYQKNVTKTLDYIENNTKSISRSLKKLVDIKENELKERRLNNEIKQKYRVQKLNTIKEKLELKRQIINLQLNSTQ